MLGRLTNACSASHISIFASSYWYLFCLRMNMKLIIYCFYCFPYFDFCLKFANLYPSTNQTAFWTALYNQENLSILSPYTMPMHEQETHRTTNTTKKFQFSVKFSFARYIRLPFCDTILLFLDCYTKTGVLILFCLVYPLPKK